MVDMLSSVSLRRLKVFLTVSNTLHMAKAAELEGVTQPALSQQIHALELGLGLKLFYRRNRGIDLTEAGKTCKIRAEQLLQAHNEAITQIQRAARGEAGRLAIGYVGSAIFEKKFLDQIHMMHRLYPETILQLSEDKIDTLLQQISSGELDAAILRAPVTIPPPLKSLIYAQQKLVVIMYRDDSLAKNKIIIPPMLKGHKMISFPDYNGIGIMRSIEEIMKKFNVPLNIGPHATSVSSLIGMVASGLGYAIVPETIKDQRLQDIEIRPLTQNTITTDLIFAWNDECVSPSLKAFQKLFKRTDWSETQEFLSRTTHPAGANVLPI